MFPHRNIVLLISILLVGSVLRFFNLDWGAPFFFHPDERNIAQSISQLSFPTQLHPDFFAYGSLPIYVTFFFALFPWGFSSAVEFDSAIMTLRIISAVFSAGTLLLTYHIGKKLGGESVGLLGAWLTACSVGMIQYAHFGTFEMWLTFWGMAFVLSLLYLHTSNRAIVISALLFGVLLSIKVSSAPLVILAFAGLCTHRSRTLASRIRWAILYGCIAFGVFVVSNPYAVIDYTGFFSSMRYESSVASGALPVFYTQHFAGTVPYVYQLVMVLPFLLNPFVAGACYVAVIWTIRTCFVYRNTAGLIVLSYIMLLFLAQGWMYVKWTRYMVPLIPPLLVLLSWMLISFFRSGRIGATAGRALCISLCIISLIYSALFLWVVHGKVDTRIAAALTLKETVSLSPPVIAEAYDLGVLPFYSSVRHPILLVDVYSIDHGNRRASLEFLRANTIILPSQRIHESRSNNPGLFPQTAGLYASLLEHPYTRIHATPCALACTILYNGDPFRHVEQTASVFDHPFVTIYTRGDEL